MNTALSPSRRVLVINGHPDPQSLNGALAARYAKGAREAGAHVDLVHVGELDFDPILRQGYRIEQPLEPDLQRLRAHIEQAQHVVWLTPLWWGSVPAALKGLFDRLLLPGWAFGYQDNGMPERKLAGRSGRWILTMDAPRWWYWSVYRGAAHGSVEQATLKFIGFKPLERTVLYGVREAGEDKIAGWLDKVEQQGRRDVAGLTSRLSSTATR